MTPRPTPVSAAVRHSLAAVAQAEQQVSFDVPAGHGPYVEAVVTRARACLEEAGEEFNLLSLAMTVAAVHCNASGPLNLRKLLASDNESFMHDIHQMRRHCNTHTGRLSEGAVLWCNAPVPAEDGDAA